jgi:hypothetical protein
MPRVRRRERLSASTERGTFRLMGNKVAVALVVVLAGCNDSLSGGADLAVADAQSDASGDSDASNAVDSSAATGYPAPHPPMPQLVNRNNGRVLTEPKIVLVFFPSYSYESDLKTFASKMAQSSYWATTTSEYGVGALDYVGTVDLTESPPHSATSGDINSWFASRLASGALGAPDPQTIYTIFYPSTTTITQPNPVSTLLPGTQSCVAWTGYHANASVAVDGGTSSFVYSVIPTCGSTIDSLTEVISHEWVEASTDPDVTATGSFTLIGSPTSAYYLPDQDHLIWAVLGGGEAGDLCEPEGAGSLVTPMDIGYVVQRTWSNAAARASHDPCVPRVSGAFFDAAPVLPETVTLSSTITGSVTTQGVTIPVGQSKTIEVDLFSDGDTGGPFTVTAADALATHYPTYFSPTMTFSWDRTTGQNGDKLHLTISVTQASPIAGGHAFMITSTLGNRKSVWPGLVVEK